MKGRFPVRSMATELQAVVETKSKAKTMAILGSASSRLVRRLAPSSTSLAIRISSTGETLATSRASRTAATRSGMNASPVEGISRMAPASGLSLALTGIAHRQGHHSSGGLGEGLRLHEDDRSLAGALHPGERPAEQDDGHLGGPGLLDGAGELRIARVLGLDDQGLGLLGPAEHLPHQLGLGLGRACRVHGRPRGPHPAGTRSRALSRPAWDRAAAFSVPSDSASRPRAQIISMLATRLPAPV